MSFTDDEEPTASAKGQRPSATNPLFVVDPPPNLATASREEIRAWSAQVVEAFKQEINRQQKPN
jgi:hypothetical protein